jgi:hypothetical protein
MDQVGVDVSGLHHELDRLKVQLCRCNHQGTCIACRGFELLREQSQAVIAAASQPVLMQVAQEAAVQDLINRVGGLQSRLAEDPQLQEMVGRLVERIQDDLGGPEAMQRMLGEFFGGVVPGKGPGSGAVPPDDRDLPPDDRPRPENTDRPPSAG